jgi:hypothetical protein
LHIHLSHSTAAGLTGETRATPATTRSTEDTCGTGRGIRYVEYRARTTCKATDTAFGIAAGAGLYILPHADVTGTCRARRIAEQNAGTVAAIGTSQTSTANTTFGSHTAVHVPAAGTFSGGHDDDLAAIATPPACTSCRATGTRQGFGNG